MSNPDNSWETIMDRTNKANKELGKTTKLVKIEDQYILEAGKLRFLFSGLMDYPDISDETQLEIDNVQTEWDEEYKLYRCIHCGHKVNSDPMGKHRHVIQFHGFNLEGRLPEWE